MKKKAILGGTFDPFHNGHLNIAYESIYKLGLDEIVFMPAGNPPHKSDKKVTDAELRYEMVMSGIKGENKFKVSKYEINKSSFSYTYETLKYFNSKEKNTEIYFITGADCLMELNLWKNVNEILQNCKFVVFNRPGYIYEDIMMQKKKVEEKYDSKIIFIDIPLLDISSTQIREKIKCHEEISYLVPEEVYGIIKANKLYI